MPQKKHKLLLDLKEEYPDFTLYGIAGNVKAVTLAWEINKQLNTDFVLKGKIQLDNIKKASQSEHPYFYYYQENDLVAFYLFVNKDGNQCLLPELKTIDYLLKIEDSNEQIDPDYILSKLKGIHSINFVMRIDPDNLKNQENLITE